MVAGSRPIEVTRVRFYHHRGRTGDMLRVSGIWISPAEIEDVLAGIALISETAAVLGDAGELGLILVLGDDYCAGLTHDHRYIGELDLPLADCV